MTIEQLKCAYLCIIKAIHNRTTLGLAFSWNYEETRSMIYNEIAKLIGHAKADRIIKAIEDN